MLHQESLFTENEGNSLSNYQGRIKFFERLYNHSLVQVFLLCYYLIIYLIKGLSAYIVKSHKYYGNLPWSGIV